MDEIEKFFKCPFCFERISMILDVSTEQTQTYIEDCEVCCNPIQITYNVNNEKVKGFVANKAYG
ncbi:MAG: CPXCG motif-containing cysteine-rich protein [Bdellovibrio sp.]|nr:CPXCG motif-containing cysteine-rich protein [Bdellovibrio sp.]